MAENFVLEMAKGINFEQRQINLFLRRIENANVTHRSLVDVFKGAISLKNSLKIQIPDDEFLRIFGFIVPKIETIEERMKLMEPKEKWILEYMQKNDMIFDNAPSIDCLLPSDLRKTLEKMTENYYTCKMPPGGITIIETGEEETRFVVPSLNKKQTEWWLELLERENWYLKNLATAVLRAKESQFELTSDEYMSGKNSENSTPIFELEIPSGEKIEVDNPFMILDKTILDYIFRISYRSKENFNGFLEKVKEIRISARARCPDMHTPRKIARISCKKYEGGHKDGINNYHKCDNCIYHSHGFGEFDDGTNLTGFKPIKVHFRQLGTKI